jgi:hypothetical protein
LQASLLALPLHAMEVLLASDKLKVCTNHGMQLCQYDECHTVYKL